VTDCSRAMQVKFYADPDAAFTKAIGMQVDLTEGGLGVRSHRYSMLVDDGKVVKVNVEKKPSEFTITNASEILKSLGDKK
jgi:glutaredoxin/glutathione-dependent peroxiredoxin